MATWGRGQDRGPIGTHAGHVEVTVNSSLGKWKYGVGESGDHS